MNKPSPALTTSPGSKATLLGHPTENRVLSVQEYARIQQFPDKWEFVGGLANKYTQIGNAVPVGLGYAVGSAVRTAIRGRRKVEKGEIVCHNKSLLERMANRPVTMINPSNMWDKKYKDPSKEAKEWMEQHKNLKREKVIEGIKYVKPFKKSSSRKSASL